MPTIDKVNQREALKPRRDPYWAKVSKGCYLGYRKMTTGSDGTWIARYFDNLTGKQEYKPLGDFSELPAAQRYDTAKNAANDWFTHLGKGGSNEVATVRMACERYTEHLLTEKSETAAADAQARFGRYVLPLKFAEMELGKLIPAHLEKWRKGLRGTPTISGPNKGEKRSDSSLNRDMTCLRAALNMAYANGLVTSDFAWRAKLLPVKNADKRRELYLDAGQRRELIAHAADDVAQLLRALCLVPLRPGAVAALTVGNYDKRLKTLTIGKDKAGKDRKITLPPATADFFAAQCKDKTPGAFLLTRANGDAWGKDAWKYPVKDAARAAGLPDEVTCYTLRHSVITDLIHSGLDALTVAQLSGTSVVMIERHYGHLTQSHAREALARLTV